MSDKDLLKDGVRLVVGEARFDCDMAKGREKNNKEASSVLFGFSKYIESLDDFIDRDDFGVFVDDIFTMIKSYLTGKKDYQSTMSEMTKYEKAFSNKFLK